MKFLITLCFLSISFCAAQSNYGFDHRMEYLFTESKDSAPEKRLVYTNSKADNYYLMLIPKEELYEVIFLDYNGFASSFTLDKKHFFENEKINLPCEIVYILKNPFHRSTRQYEVIQKDTLIKKEKFQLFILKNKNERKEERQNLVRHYYVLDRNNEVHSPVPLFHQMHEKNKIEDFLPEGVFNAMFNVSYKNDTTEYYKLQHVSRVTKMISFDDNCANLK